jgi:hypothetical protein
VRQRAQARAVTGRRMTRGLSRSRWRRDPSAARTWGSR